MTDDQPPMAPIERLRVWWSNPANEGAVIIIKLVFAFAAIAAGGFIAYRVTLVLMAR